MSEPVRIACRAVLVDIEGTTSPIAFVHDVLFPYADEHLDEYIAAHRTEPLVAQAMRAAAGEIVDEVAREGRGATARTGRQGCVDDSTVREHLHRWITEDRKSTPLKTLQGSIWAEGYEIGRLRSRIYPDAADALRQWHAAGFALYVYSSGSIAAQQTLFAYSDQGDLRDLFAGYFDTTTGPKKEAASYSSIARAVAHPPRDIVFLSDVEAELGAAQTAGMQTVRLLRPADTPPGAATRHTPATTFDDVALIFD